MKRSVWWGEDDHASGWLHSSTKRPVKSPSGKGDGCQNGPFLDWPALAKVTPSPPQVLMGDFLLFLDEDEEGFRSRGRIWP